MGSGPALAATPLCRLPGHQAPPAQGLCLQGRASPASSLLQTPSLPIFKIAAASPWPWSAVLLPSDLLQKVRGKLSCLRTGCAWSQCFCANCHLVFRVLSPWTWWKRLVWFHFFACPACLLLACGLLGRDLIDLFAVPLVPGRRNPSVARTAPQWRGPAGRPGTCRQGERSCASETAHPQQAEARDAGRACPSSSSWRYSSSLVPAADFCGQGHSSLMCSRKRPVFSL